MDSKQKNTKSLQNLNESQLKTFELGLKMIHLLGLVREYAGLDILDLLPSGNIRKKCEIMINAPDNFLKSFKNKVGKDSYEQMVELVDGDYELLGEKYEFLKEIVMMNREQFNILKNK